MVYAYVSMNITKPENLARYRERAGEALAKYDGAVLTAGKENTVMEGSMIPPPMAAILSFPNKESAHSWINDPELVDIHELRRSSGDVSIVLIG